MSVIRQIFQSFRFQLFFGATGIISVCRVISIRAIMAKSPPNDMQSPGCINDVEGRVGIIGGSGPMVTVWMGSVV